MTESEKYDNSQSCASNFGNLYTRRKSLDNSGDSTTTVCGVSMGLGVGRASQVESSQYESKPVERCYQEVFMQRQETLRESNTIPVVGFLYSVSKPGCVEYWPLHLGTNTIGRSEDSNVVLREKSVSKNHAVINLKLMRQSGEVIASIRDVGSKNGMYVNEVELDYEQHVCKSGDILTIGFNYKLLLILVSAAKLGLKVSENFEACGSRIPNTYAGSGCNTTGELDFQDRLSDNGGVVYSERTNLQEQYRADDGNESFSLYQRAKESNYPNVEVIQEIK